MFADQMNATQLRNLWKLVYDACHKNDSNITQLWAELSYRLLLPSQVGYPEAGRLLEKMEERMYKFMEANFAAQDLQEDADDLQMFKVLLPCLRSE